MVVWRSFLTTRLELNMVLVIAIPSALETSNLLTERWASFILSAIDRALTSGVGER